MLGKSASHLGREGVADVAIIGAGPVGLALAADLLRHGVRPIVLDGKAEISWSSRAICLSRRSQEVFERIGAGPAFKAKGLPWSRGRTFYQDRLAFELELPCSPDDRHAPFINLQQYYTEQFLLDAVERAAGGTPAVLWSHSVRGLQAGRDQVRLDVDTLEGPGSIQARWVVAADGARSAARQALGLKLQGSSYEGRYLIADIAVEGVSRPVERHVWFDPRSNPGSTVILHVQPDGIWRIDIQLRDDDSDAMLEDARLLPLLQAQLDMMGVAADWRLVWKSIYRAHALTLDRYRHGRVLFAGDAAHLVPIFGVRGLNSGIDDAHNLAWKLARVVRGDAPETLLDSYSTERVRATHENLAAATKSTWFMSPPGRGFELMRDAVLALSSAQGWASGLLNPRQSTAHRYETSPIVLHDNDPAGLPPGTVVPNVAATHLHQGRRRHGHLQDALAPARFTLLLFADHLPPDATEALAAEPPEDVEVVIIAHADRLAAGTGIADDDGSIEQRFGAEHWPVYLIRPDEHVAARWRACLPADVAAALAHAAGRSPQAAPAVAGGAAVRHDTPLEQMFEAIANALPPSDGAAAAFLGRLCLLLCHELGDERRLADLVVRAGEPTSAGDARC